METYSKIIDLCDSMIKNIDLLLILFKPDENKD